MIVSIDSVSLEVLTECTKPDDEVGLLESLDVVAVYLENSDVEISSLLSDRVFEQIENSIDATI